MMYKSILIDYPSNFIFWRRFLNDNLFTAVSLKKWHDDVLFLMSGMTGLTLPPLKNQNLLKSPLYNL